MKQLASIVAAVGLVTAGATNSRADYLNWSYHWALSDGPTFTSGFSNVAFALHPGASVGASEIPVGNFSTNSASPSIDSFHATYGLTLTLTDNATKDAAHLTFHGTLTGSVGANSSSATNTFSDPTQSVTLDGHVYHVTVDSTTGVKGPNDGITAISAQVSVANASGSGSNAGGGTQSPGGSGPPTVHQSPEPSALLLSGLGLCLSISFRYRRLRRANSQG
jgi:hypothetical protein